MEEENKKQETGVGLSKEQLSEELDIYNSQLVILKQEKVLNDFDLENFEETLSRKARDNKRKTELLLSNIKVTEKSMETALTNAEIIAKAEEREAVAEDKKADVAAE